MKVWVASRGPETGRETLPMVLEDPAEKIICYLRRRLASEGIVQYVMLGVTPSCRVCVRCISLGGEGNALYPVLSSCKLFLPHD